MIKDKYFDSCAYPISLSEKKIDLQKKLFLKYKIYKACLHIKNYNQNNFSKINRIIKKTNFFIPIFHYQNKISLKKQINFIAKNNFKIIKIHPRFLKKDLKKNFSSYKKIFNLCEKKKITIMFCTFSSFEKKVLDYDQLFYLSKLVNLTSKTNVVLMHSGGSDLIKYYERFRFKYNVYLDLSYTAQHYCNTSVFEDILFLIEKFDKRIVIGSDYPSLSLDVFKKVNKLFKKKIIKKKFNNIIKNNLENLINEVQK